MSATSPVSPWPHWDDSPGLLVQQDVLSLGATLSQVPLPTSADTNRGPLHPQKGWMENISFPWKEPILPQRPHQRHIDPQDISCLWKPQPQTPLGAPPANIGGVANYFQQPKPGSPSRGRTRLGQSTLKGGEKEQKEDLHPRWLSALAWPPRRKQSLEGYKGKGPHEYLGITHTMGSGDGDQRLCW